MSSFKADSYFTAEAVTLAKHFISQNGGNEIVMVGKVNADGLVYDLRRAAMGNSNSVPAVIATAQPGEILIHNHPSGNVSPSAADLEVAARAAEKSVGSYIVDNQLTNIFPVVERIMPESTETEPLDCEEVAGIFSKNGRLAQSDSEFEFRMPQVKMAVGVAEAVNTSSVLVAEAGTGTGKSFAYLVPILLYVSKNRGKKAVVSTSTIALQEQLYNKDIPALLKKLDIEDVGTVVLKGRANYLCKRKYSAFRMGAVQTKIEEDAASKNSLDTVDEIDRWLNRTDDGSRSSMNSAVAVDIWNEICADELACEKSKCRFFNSCFFFKARRRANFASLILVNHHLLMADVSMKSEEDESEGILPKFDILVIDEAHNIFKSAVSFLGESVSSNSVKKLLGKLYNTSNGQGLLTKILSNNADSMMLKPLEKAVNILSSGIQGKIYNSFFPELIASLNRNGDENLYELDNPEKREKMSGILGQIVAVLAQITDLVAPVVKQLKEKDEEILLRSAMDDLNRSLITDLEATVAKINAQAEFYSEFCIGTNTETQVFWGEKNGDSLTLTISPLNVQKILADNLYKQTKTLVFTSATLTTGKGESGFGFFYRESGLALCEREKNAMSLESCFDYATQVKAFIGSDMPDPARDRELFDSESIDAAREIVKASGGGALVLFTSISHREAALKYFKDLDFDVISQGKLPVQAILKKFREDVNATLLATETFWEGIDMKGETLRNLVIIKLPFRFPSHPFIKRYVAKLEQETGESGFIAYTLPNAVLKFKQGFGRLIRTKNDIGTVTVLDKRISGKYYGKDFILAVPSGVRFRSLPVAAIAEEIKDFFGRNA